MLERPN